MGLRYLLDATTLSNPAKLNPSELLLRKLGAHRDEVATCATALHEMVYGYERLPEGKKQTRIAEYLEQTLTGIPVLAYDEPAARWYASERNRLDRIGRKPPFEDGQIAAVAFVNGLILVPDNISDFESFQDLTL